MYLYATIRARISEAVEPNLGMGKELGAECRTKACSLNPVAFTSR